MKQAIADRTKSCLEAHEVAWVVQGVIDGLRMGYTNAGQFVISKLKDIRFSYVEVLLLKLKVREHLLHKWLPRLDTTSNVRETITDVFKSFESVRSRFSAYPDMSIPDLTWPTGWPEHATQLAQFIDDMVYSSTFDGRYKDV